MKRQLLRKNEKSQQSLMREIRDTERSIILASQRFQSETDEDMIEAVLYEIMSLKARYNYLLRLAQSPCDPDCMGEMSLSDYIKEAEIMG